MSVELLHHGWWQDLWVLCCVRITTTKSHSRRYRNCGISTEKQVRRWLEAVEACQRGILLQLVEIILVHMDVDQWWGVRTVVAVKLWYCCHLMTHNDLICADVLLRNYARCHSHWHWDISTATLNSSVQPKWPVWVPGTVVIEWAHSVSWQDGIKGVPEPGLVWFC